MDGPCASFRCVLRNGLGLGLVDDGPFSAKAMHKNHFAPEEDQIKREKPNELAATNDNTNIKRLRTADRGSTRIAGTNSHIR